MAPGLLASYTESGQAKTMKTHFVMALVGAVAAPAVIASVGPLDGSLDSDSDIYAKAEEIARKEFSVSANLSVEKVWIMDERTGTFGERIRPDPGYLFHYVQARIENTGKLDIAVSTWHFSAIDEAGSDHSVELANAHEDFDASRLGRGHARDGLVIFEIEKGSYLTGLVWQGDLGEANTTIGAYEHP